MKAMVSSVGLLLLLEVVAAGIASAQTPDAAVKVMSLSVERAADGVTVRVKTSGPPKYQSSFLDSPSRLVIDFPGATYAWNKTTLHSDSEPVREVRGGQWKDNMARVVVELSRKVGYRIDKDSGGLSIVLEPAGTAQAAAPRVGTPRMEARAGDPAKTEAALDREVMATVTPGPLPAVEPRAAPAPARIAQASPATPPPTPGGQAPSGDKLISLDFKDADVVNLLRILAAESGRNIVVGEDVKGKVSVSLHNVTWEQALGTILEARGLSRLDRDGIIRIVSTDQLTKEREGLARVREAQVKAEVDNRTKWAEAELRETEAASRKFQAEAKIADARARGPLREEAIRLSYADPGEVANTLQGILALGQQTSEIKPCRTIEKEKFGEARIRLGSGGATSGPIAEPPFSQLFGPPRPPEQAPPPQPPVPEVLVGKGLVISAHCPTNTLFLRLFEADLERTKKLIKENLDVPSPQVKIEARMEILDRSAFEGIGVQWGGSGAGNINNTTTLVGQGFQTQVGKDGVSRPALTGILLPDGSVAPLSSTPALSSPGTPARTQFAPNNPTLNLNQFFPISASTGLPLGGNVVNLPFAALPGAGVAGQPAGGISFGLVSGNFNINLALQALASQGKTRTLARPEIVMLENTLGTISLGEDVPYVVVSSAGANTVFKEAALRLDVFPTVVREQVGPKIVEKFKMLVTVENNSRGENTSAGPIIQKRKADTQVIIKAGDRLIIGGVTQGLSSTTVRKVPIFGDIPIFGWLFKQKENSEAGRELVIFVTPSLVTGQGSAGMAITPIAPK